MCQESIGLTRMPPESSLRFKITNGSTLRVTIMPIRGAGRIRVLLERLLWHGRFGDGILGTARLICCGESFRLITETGDVYKTQPVNDIFSTKHPERNAYHQQPATRE